MSRIFIVIISVLAFLNGQIAVAENLTQRNALPDIIEYVLNCFAEEQKTKGLVLVEKIIDFDECRQISKLGFLFDFFRPLSMPASRQIITSLVNDLVLHVNKQEKLKNYLSHKPFTVNDVVVRLRLRNKDCGFIYPMLGNIAYVSVIDGEIIYDTINSFTYDLDTLRTESFADALKILTPDAF